MLVAELFHICKQEITRGAYDQALVAEIAPELFVVDRVFPEPLRA
jgi:hypothetical protein